MTTRNKPSKGLLWTSYILQVLLCALFIMGAVGNIMQSETAVTMGTEMGYPIESLTYLGIVLLISTLLYLIPQTCILGAALLTAWLGGAIATHIIHNDPVQNALFPVVFGVLIWGLLLMRNEKLRQLMPFVKN